MIFHPLHTHIQPPEEMNNPFDYKPHPLCLVAAEEVQASIARHTEWQDELHSGKMFGVLIVENPDDGAIGYLAAYSGQLLGRSDWEGFVPAVYDYLQPDGHFKVANPTLTVWQACGDGDALAIGGNHFIHAIRRNIDINIILFNNRIYGLTKGQYSPTSKFGAITKTSPYGTVEHPFNPGSLVLGAKGTFFARSLDVELKLNEEIMTAAALHDGCSVMEMLTNCVIFNDGAHRDLSDPAVKADHTIILHHGEKMLFGKDRDRGLIYDGRKIRAVRIGEGGFTEDDILVHDAHTDNIGLHMALADMKGPDYPVALGVIRDVKDITYDDGVRDQVKDVMAKSKIHSVDELLHSGSTWEVE
mgnify:CR=1 FL=1